MEFQGSEHTSELDTTLETNRNDNCNKAANQWSMSKTVPSAGAAAGKLPFNNFQSNILRIFPTHVCPQPSHLIGKLLAMIYAYPIIVCELPRKVFQGDSKPWYVVRIILKKQYETHYYKDNHPIGKNIPTVANKL